MSWLYGSKTARPHLVAVEDAEHAPAVRYVIYKNSEGVTFCVRVTAGNVQDIEAIAHLYRLPDERVFIRTRPRWQQL